MKIPADLQPYWNLLKHLRNEQKLTLIELLVQSVKSDIAEQSEVQKQDDDWVQKYYGSWNDFPETAAEMIEVIEESKKIQASQRLEKLKRFAGDAKFSGFPVSKDDFYEQ